ncbi:odorant receptor 82a isoform X2 [Halictus rubicundus]|uniref:odorant receptor 82a isoform X2 n=1 Tax=Halictus rubicundus TaxID=77578 RepID=UPI004036D658
MKEPAKSSIDYYILPNRIFCGMAGMWPIEDNSSTFSKLFAYFRLLFALTAVSSVFVPEILAIAVNWGDLKVLAGVGCVLTSVGQLLFKMMYLLSRRKRMYQLYYELRNLWDSSDDPDERQPYVQLANWARLLTIVFYSSCMCNVITFATAAAIDYFHMNYNVSDASNDNRHLPFEVWYGTDIVDSPKFEIAFICQFIASLICCAGISGLDATFMTIILHVCGQFKLINIWINKICCDDNRLPQFKVDLLKCVQHHQRVINVVREVNNLLAPIIFVQFLTSGVEICLSGFAVFDNGTGTDLLKFISYLTSMGIQLVLWCWPGEILVQESQQIGHVIYLNLPWYNLPPIYRRQLCLIIVRAQQQCSISALTFQTISISTLTSVFNTAASYFTLMRQMQQK